MTTDPPDLRTLAARAICDSFDSQPDDAHRPYPPVPLFVGTTSLPPPEPPCAGCFTAADAVLSAVLPAHRAMVLREAADELAPEIAWQREKYGDGTDRVATGRLIGMEDAATTVRRLAATAPPAPPAPTVEPKNGPAVPAPTPTPDGGAKAPARWRVGRKVGRTVYRQAGPDPADSDVLVGLMDTPELAAFAVEAMNRAGGDNDAT